MDPESVVRANSKFPGIREQGIYRRTPIESIQIFRERAIEGADLTELGVKKVGKDTRGKQSQEGASGLFVRPKVIRRRHANYERCSERCVLKRTTN